MMLQILQRIVIYYSKTLLLISNLNCLICVFRVIVWLLRVSLDKAKYK